MTSQRRPFDLPPAGQMLDAVDALADIVAARVVMTMQAAGSAPARREAGLLTAQELAEALGLTRRWVYDHQDELGVIRLGEGRHARLRFDLAEVRSRLAQTFDGRREGGPVAATPRRRRAQSAGGPRLSDLLGLSSEASK